ncbi:MAG: histidine--tRNA ligase [Patescibacteria group bacterium]
MPSKKNRSQFELKTPKGTRDLIGEEVFQLSGFAEKASEIARYYGFQAIETPMIEKEELFNRGIGTGTDIIDKEIYNLKTKGGDHLALRPEGTAPIIRAYFEHGLQSKPQPVMFYYFGPFFRHDKPQKGRWRQFWQFGLEILGSKHSISDATIIRLNYLILETIGLKNPVVNINSLGDTECRLAFQKDLNAYYRKNAKNICADCRQRLKTNPLRVLDCKSDKCQPIKAEAPQILNYLNPESKKHFQEVLEYLDKMKIDYEIDPLMVRGLDYYNRTVFEIKLPITDEEGKTTDLAVSAGGRYDSLSKILGEKKELPAVGSSIGVDRLLMLDETNHLKPKAIKNPKIYFIQLSQEAKMKSFEIIEILRAAKIPITHSIAKNSLSAQLGIAEKSKASYVIILGQKEALDNTVIVRNLKNRSQDTIAIDKLSQYLKKLK